MTNISRRAVLASGSMALASCTGALPTLEGSSEITAQQRPNILWLVSEDNNPFIGAYGDILAQTPNIDQLAREGILYKHAYSNAPVCAPSRYAMLTGMHPESNAPANNMRADALLPAGLKTYPELLRAAGYYCTNNAKTDYNAVVDPNVIWNANGPDAHYTNRPDGAPFMAVYNFQTTHESSLFQVTDGAVKPADVRVPAYLPDTPEVRQDYASYYNLMEKMDAEVGAKLAELEQLGLTDDTIVFYYSDNGGVLPRSKRYCYEEGLRVPLIVRLPPKWAHLAPVGKGQSVHAPVSLIDLPPTLLSLAGIAKPAIMQGSALLGQKMEPPKTYAFGMRDRMDERIDCIRTVTDGRYRYIRNYMPHRTWGQTLAFPWMLKSYQSWHRQYLDGALNATQARFFGAKPFEELYDLTRDPDQVTNLANEPEHAATLTTLRAALDAHVLAINDNGFIPEGTVPSGFDESHAAGAYPLEAIMATAALAAGGHDGAAPQLLARLKDSNAVIRYWAAIGLLIRKEQAAAFAAPLLAVMRSDSSTSVRIVAAEALADGGHHAEACAVLASILNGSDPTPVKLAALNALSQIADPGPAMGAVTTLVANKDYLGRLASFVVAVQNGTFRPERPWAAMGR